VRPLSEQSHYEVLEVGREAPPDGIERAYRLILATYAEGSLAGYSVVRGADAAAIRERVETAYRVLSNAEARRSYDASLAEGGRGGPAAAPEPEALPEEVDDVVVRRSAAPAAVEPFEDAEEGGEYDGARLRRARLRRGLDFEEIALRTKVNASYLGFLEDERYADLPPRVYVRGFVMAFAGCVGLDPVAVAASYMRRYDAEQPRQRRRFSRGT
jgi:DnaJ-class molecular chaperone